MSSVEKIAVPADALLLTYAKGARPQDWGNYADAFSISVDAVVTLEQFVLAFYTTPLFRAERLLLRLFIRAPSTDDEARAVARGTLARFAAWYVGERTANQLLMCDRFESTRSWFSVVSAGEGKTLLRFGSALAASRPYAEKSSGRGPGFRFLLGMHVLYSKLLLRSARRRILRLSFPPGSR